MDVEVQGARLRRAERPGHQHPVVRAAREGLARDVARVELGGKSYGVVSRLNGATSASLAIYQLPGANALDVARQLGAKFWELCAAIDLARLWGDAGRTGDAIVLL